MKQEHIDDVDAINNRVIKLISLKKWERALKEAALGIAKFPECVALRYNTALCLMQLGKYTESNRELITILEYEPDYVIAFNLLARIASIKKLYPEGIAWIKKALETDSENADHHAVYAILLYESHQLRIDDLFYKDDLINDAIYEAKEALQLDPNNKTANQIYSIILTSNHINDDSEIQVEKMLESNPENAFAWYQNAVNHLNRGDLEEAQKAIIKTLEINPENHEAQDIYFKLIARKHPLFSFFWRIIFFIQKIPEKKRQRFVIIYTFSILILSISSSIINDNSNIPSYIISFHAYLIAFGIIMRLLFIIFIKKGWLK